MRDVRLHSHAQLLRAIAELRKEWIEAGCPASLEEGSLFRRLTNLYACIGSEAEEMANLIDPQVVILKEVS